MKYLALALLIQTICSEVGAQSESQKVCETWSQIKGNAEGDSLINEFPYMAGIGYGSEEARTWACGGSLISEKFVLTAAQCLYSMHFGMPNTVRLGASDLNATNDSASQDYKIKRTIPYPDYTRRSKYNDIALIELSDDIKFGEHIRPACLQVEDQISAENLTAVGWGLIGLNESSASHLRKLYMREFTRRDCNEFYENTTRTLRSGVADTQICAREDDMDTCQVESGSPLQIRNGLGLYSVIAISSFGRACGYTAPGVYTRVSKYVDWIESIVWS